MPFLSTMHYGTSTADRRYKGVTQPQAFDRSDAFHIWSMVRSKDQMRFFFQKPAVVSLAVFDNVGRRVAQVLDSEQRPAGQFTARLNAAGLNAAGLAPGLYTCHLLVDGVALGRPLSVE